MSKKRIKKPKSDTQGRVVKAELPPDYENNPPVFSLEKLQNGAYCFSKLSKDDKASFGDAIFKRKSLTWNEIKSSGRHALGTEKIPKSQINAPIPNFITEDFKDFLVFRFSGRKPMVGYRQKDAFFVLWFDHDFTLYNHG